MTAPSTFRMKPYIQPFERELALQELEGLCGETPLPSAAKDFESAETFTTTTAVRGAGEKLAYWESVGPQANFTTQVLREASAAIARNGVNLSDIPEVSKSEVRARIPRKRSLRYGTHGIHEYRGKFFPQLVKALVNISRVSEGSAILDPMCGSGTTVVEAVTEGHSAVGIDMNPLSVFVSDVKCRLLTLKPSALIQAHEELSSNLDMARSVATNRDHRDEAYLCDWFDSDVLDELDQIAAAISELRCFATRDFYRVALSNVLRALSYQKEADLRIRREVKNVTRGEALAAFRSQALRSTKSVVAYLAHGELRDIGPHRVTEGDARSYVADGRVAPGTIDLVITSPPYATALPYLDTDRLSLIYLGLLPRTDHRSRDKLMIGNREVTDRGRRELWGDYLVNQACLPSSVSALINRITTENEGAEVGFRRRNLPALLGRYFMDMKSVLSETHRALKPGSSAFFVVGNNRTTTGAGEIEIETAHLLAEMAQESGFSDCEMSSMDMLTSRDLFSKNQTPSEHIIKLRKSEVAKSSS